MKAKKINAILGILTACLLFDHTLSCSILLLNRDLSKATPVPPFILTGIMLLHIVLTSAVVMHRHEGHSKQYGFLYVRTILQRMTAFLMIAVLPFHVYAGVALRNGRPVETLLAVSVSLFTLFSMVHTAVSLPNALVTLGFLSSEKRYRAVSYVSYAVFGSLAVLGILSGVIFLWK